ncbi:6-phosphogluconolactonase [Nocardioides sp. JQ2195]|uniref:6-phosphogluconolactonase n=1 Tax=Nocardioides sp. JQ2195 TaxID=2592334 RepID=UPI00143E2DCE|nr:6-phosphogluconolactonase [Nocardioides sp. JQ2195]QIX26796.1 6-phosphogluconolactonase [Nocardioides sp. JQ2195]
MSPTTRVEADSDALAEAVAEALIARLAEIQAEGRVPTVGLTGGTIAREVHRKVASSLNSFDVDWDEVDFWWGDERYVDSSSDDRNARQARRDLLDHVDVDPSRVHEMPAADSGLSLQEAAEAYAAEMREQGSGGFDVLMLGLGPDGHIASLFPGSAQIDARDAITVAVARSPKPPPERISLTFEAMARSNAVWFIVAGAEKAEAVARSMVDTDVHASPAVGVAGAEETVWWLDRAAAGHSAT